MKTTLSKSELDKLISDVQGQVDTYLAAESQKLSKAKEEASPESPEASAPAPAPEASSGGDASPAGEPSGESAPAPAPEGVAPDAAPAAPADPSASASAAPAGQDPAADITTDPVALKAEYAKLDDAQLQAHYLAAREAVYERMSAGGASGAPAGGPSAGAPAPADAAAAPAAPAPAPAAPAAPAGPAASPSPAPGEEPPPPAMKSEKDGLTELKKKFEELEKNAKAERELSAKAIDLLTRPMRKSLTGKDIVTKPAEKPLAKSEVIAKLNAKVREARGNLKKSDKDLIAQFCVGKVGVEKIQHLLQD